MKVLDLFCGAAGGWSLGLHRAGGFTTVAACEIDPWRREQFSKNFPEARLYDDVRTLTADRLRADGAFPDIIVGSPPCQDASTANANGKGIDGARTGLFMEWVRLVAECRPRWACAENVPGIRSRGIDRVLGKLEAIDYAFWPLVVGASDLGANHIRKRLVLVAADASQDGWRERAARRSGVGAARAQDIASGAMPHSNRQGQHAGAGHAGEVAWCTGDARHAANANRPRLEIGQGVSADDGAQRAPALGNGARPRHHWSATAPAFGRVDDGLPDKVARACISAYGDSFAPQKAELIGRAILSLEAA